MSPPKRRSRRSQPHHSMPGQLEPMKAHAMGVHKPTWSMAEAGLRWGGVSTIMAAGCPQSEWSVVVRASTIIRDLAKARTRTGEMAQSERCLRSSGPEHPHQKPGVAVHIHIPAPGRQK